MPMSPKEMLTLLKENGFETVNQNGSNTDVFPDPFFPTKTFIPGFNVNFLFSNLL